jgi:carboxymethylenebutenolidase
MIGFTQDGHQYQGYLSPATTGKGPGVVVIQEWWGLVPHIVDVADRFAQAGFTAFAPDLYQGKTTTEPDEAATLMQALNIGETEALLRKAILTLMVQPSAEGNKIGIVGFCMGGQLAMFAAGHNPVIQATVNFYGIHPKVVPSYRTLNGPVLGIFAEHDNYASPEAVQALDRELTVFGKDHIFVTYPGTHHAFFNDTRPEVFDPEAASDAWQRTIGFLNDELR